MDSLFTALAEPRRRKILESLGYGEKPAGEIAALFPNVTRPAISQHLRVLKEAGLILERREGVKRLYRTNPEPLEEMLEYLKRFHQKGLQQLKTLAEEEQRRKDAR